MVKAYMSDRVLARGACVVPGSWRVVPPKLRCRGCAPWRVPGINTAVELVS